MSADKNKSTFPFPHATGVTTITGRPDPLSLGILQGELYANAMSIPTELGGGLYGHLALIMPTAEYASLDGAVAYVTPAHPGVQADAPANATAIMMIIHNVDLFPILLPWYLLVPGTGSIRHNHTNKIKQF